MRTVFFAALLSACTAATAKDAPGPMPTPEPVPVPVPADPRDAAGPEGPRPCPPEMVLVEGSYCPVVEQRCLRWLDPTTSPYHTYRCEEYAAPAKCLSRTREKRRFCIDREEWVAPGDALPLAHQSYTSASKVCASRGARLCLESEWQLACEGEDMHPYPYGAGFKRDASACNIDRMDLGKPQTGLRDLREPATARPQCTSPFGVHMMSGNVEEWATKDDGKLPDRSTMKGSWWLPGKNTCRARTIGHGEIYEGPQTGIRCCKDAP